MTARRAITVGLSLAVGTLLAGAAMANALPSTSAAAEPQSATAVSQVTEDTVLRPAIKHVVKKVKVKVHVPQPKVAPAPAPTVRTPSTSAPSAASTTKNRSSQDSGSDVKAGHDQGDDDQYGDDEGEDDQYGEDGDHGGDDEHDD